MKEKKRNKGLIFSVLLSAVFHLRWTVPAWIFLGLHLWKGISLRWFTGCIILWVLFVTVKVLLFGSLAKAGDYKEPPKENKNPYSKKNL